LDQCESAVALEVVAFVVGSLLGKAVVAVAASLVVDPSTEDLVADVAEASVLVAAAIVAAGFLLVMVAEFAGTAAAVVSFSSAIHFAPEFVAMKE